MRKGAAGSVEEILSSAIRVTSTFADVAYSKASGSPGAFFIVVVDNLPQIERESKPKYVKFSPKRVHILWKTRVSGIFCGKLIGQFSRSEGSSRFVVHKHRPRSISSLSDKLSQSSQSAAQSYHQWQ